MKDVKLLEKALRLLPELITTETEARRAIELKKDGCVINAVPANDYRTRKLTRGDTLILDFGDHQVGPVSLNLGTAGSHADAPVWLRLHFAEQPVELFEEAKNYRGWVSSSWIEEEQVHVDVLPSVYTLPRRYAFRYLKIEVLDISPKFSLLVRDAVCHSVSSADDAKLAACSFQKPEYARLDRIAVRTLHNCMQRVFEDGPKRDRRLWIGDLRIQALCNYETYRMNDMVKACLYLFAALPMADGKVGACLFLEPEPEVDDTQMFDYSLFFTDTLYDYVCETDDTEALADLWPTALRQINLALTQLNERGVVADSDRLGWCFLDWNLSLNKQTGAQGVLLYTLKRGISLAERMGDAETAASLQAKYAELKTAANSVLWDAEKKAYISGADRQVSFASQVWMVLGGATEGADALRLLKSMERQTDCVGMVTPYMYHNYVDALITAGDTDYALSRMAWYWGQMADRGADTFFELFNPDDPDESPYGGTIVNSYCHAWSCGPAYFLRKFEKEEQG